MLLLIGPGRSRVARKAAAMAELDGAVIRLQHVGRRDVAGVPEEAALRIHDLDFLFLAGNGVDGWASAASPALPGSGRGRVPFTFISIGFRTGPSSTAIVPASASHGIPPACPDKIMVIASACCSLAFSSMNTATLPLPSWMAFGYMPATMYRTPLSETSPYIPSDTSPPISISQPPLSGRPPNWQLQPVVQLQPSILWTVMRYGTCAMTASLDRDNMVSACEPRKISTRVPA